MCDPWERRCPAGANEALVLSGSSVNVTLSAAAGSRRSQGGVLAPEAAWSGSMLFEPLMSEALCLFGMRDEEVVTIRMRTYPVRMAGSPVSELDAIGAPVRPFIAEALRLIGMSDKEVVAVPVSRHPLGMAGSPFSEGKAIGASVSPLMTEALSLLGVGNEEVIAILVSCYPVGVAAGPFGELYAIFDTIESIRQGGLLLESTAGDGSKRE